MTHHCRNQEHPTRKYIETVLIHLARVCISLLSHVPEGEKKVIDPAGFFLAQFPGCAEYSQDNRAYLRTL